MTDELREKAKYITPYGGFFNPDKPVYSKTIGVWRAVYQYKDYTIWENPFTYKYVFSNDDMIPTTLYDNLQEVMIALPV